MQLDFYLLNNTLNIRPGLSLSVSLAGKFTSPRQTWCQKLTKVTSNVRQT